MRCLACDAGLSEEQARKKMPVSGEYWDLCGACLRAIRVGFGLNVAPPVKPGVNISMDEARQVADDYLREHGFDQWGRHMLEVDSGEDS